MAMSFRGIGASPLDFASRVPKYSSGSTKENTLQILLTGAAGFIGSHLAERLLEQGDSVVGVDSFSPYYDPAVKRRNIEAAMGHDSYRLVEGDLRELELEPLVAEADAILHLAAQPGVRPSWGHEFQIYVNDNVLATQHLLEAACGSGIERFVLASSSSIYGEAESFPTAESAVPRPVSPYGVTKHAGEQLCHLYHVAHGVPTVALRYFTIFGPRQRPDMAFARFIEAATKGEALSVYGDGGQSRSFTYVEDAVEATIAAASRGVPGAAYNVAGGSQASVLEVIQILEGLLGREIAVEHMPPVPGDARKTGADTAAARRDLGFEPRVSLEEGLARQVDAQAATRPVV
jgi:UDP-glucuronate 4-epimerase